MVAAKKKLVAIEQNHVAPRVTGNGNRDQISIDLKWIAAGDYDLHASPAGAVVCMHNPLAIETLGEASMIGDVVLMREKHCAHAAHGFNLLDELSREPG